MRLDDDPHEVARFAHAVALGQIADLEFEEECLRLGVRHDGESSPAELIGEAEKPFVVGRLNG